MLTWDFTRLHVRIWATALVCLWAAIPLRHIAEDRGHLTCSLLLVLFCLNWGMSEWRRRLRTTEGTVR